MADNKEKALHKPQLKLVLKDNDQNDNNKKSRDDNGGETSLPHSDTYIINDEKWVRKQHYTNIK